MSEGYGETPTLTERRAPDSVVSVDRHGAEGVVWVQEVIVPRKLFQADGKEGGERDSKDFAVDVVGGEREEKEEKACECVARSLLDVALRTCSRQ